MTYLSVFTIAVAGISLLVGAIGIANIMLVSVTERTREIGIRKAIGATHRAIMKQFLIESVVLAGLGGTVGILLGISTTIAAAAIIPRLAPKFGPPHVSIAAIAIAFAVSLTIGVLAGGYPARRAARLRPIDALRHEQIITARAGLDRRIRNVPNLIDSDAGSHTPHWGLHRHARPPSLPRPKRRLDNSLTRPGFGPFGVTPRRRAAITGP